MLRTSTSRHLLYSTDLVLLSVAILLLPQCCINRYEMSPRYSHSTTSSIIATVYTYTSMVAMNTSSSMVNDMLHYISLAMIPMSSILHTSVYTYNMAMVME